MPSAHFFLKQFPGRVRAIFQLFLVCVFWYGFALQQAEAAVGSYTAPSAGVLTITLKGADGGDSTANNPGGSGATVQAVFNVEKFQVVQYITGGAGATSTNCGGGGGSSGVYIGGSLVMVAGGGGGGDNTAGQGGNTGVNGDPGTDGGLGSAGAAGAAGNGGMAGDGGGILGPGGGGGGGRLSAGTIDPGTGGKGAINPTTQAAGGTGVASGGVGYSGGGACVNFNFIGGSAGGGGGYSGGGAAGVLGSAGGGGSFVDTARVGYQSSTFTAGVNGGAAATPAAGTIQLNLVPTSVTIEHVSLEAWHVQDFLDTLGAEGMDAAALYELLASWDQAAAGNTSETDRSGILDALGAYLDPDGDGQVAVLEWVTAQEIGTIGFYVERQDANGQWQRINNGMVPGLITAPMGGQYLLADPTAPSGNDLNYRLVEQEATGSTRSYGPYTLKVPF